MTGRVQLGLRANAAQFAVLVADPYQGQGLGTALLEQLLEAGRAEGIRLVTGDILAENRLMLSICRQLGFRLELQPGSGVVKAVIEL